MIEVVRGDEPLTTGFSEGGLGPHDGCKESLQSEMSFRLLSLLPYVVFVLGQGDQILHLLQLLLSHETGLLKKTLRTDFTEKEKSNCCDLDILY